MKWNWEKKSLQLCEKLFFLEECFTKLGLVNSKYKLIFNNNLGRERKLYTNKVISLTYYSDALHVDGPIIINIIIISDAWPQIKPKWHNLIHTHCILSSTVSSSWKQTGMDTWLQYEWSTKKNSTQLLLNLCRLWESGVLMWNCFV